MLTFFLTVVFVVAIGWAVIGLAPEGWRTRLFHAIAISVPGLGALVEASGGIDWSKLIDQPKVAYGLAVGIPIVGLWLRELTKTPAGSP